MQRSLMSHYQSNERFGEPDLPSKVGFFENQQDHVSRGELADRSVKLLTAKHLTVRHGVAELAHLATCPPVELRNKPVDRLAEIDMMRPLGRVPPHGSFRNTEGVVDSCRHVFRRLRITRRVPRVFVR